MVQSSKKYTKILCATIAGILALTIGVNLLARFTNVVGNFSSFRTGRFIYASQVVSDYGWYLSAQEANGSNTFFIDLSEYRMRNIVVISEISYGEMSLELAQGETTHSFDLSNNIGEKFIGDIVADIFDAGRLEMRLVFVNAQNISVTANWQ